MNGQDWEKFPRKSPSFFMKEALKLAQEAGEQGDVPVGCVVVQGEQIIGRGKNCRELISDATAHAEILAIREACQTLGRWRLSDCQLYVTLEPCAMCTGSIINSKINSLYYGAAEGNTGCCCSKIDLFQEGLGHKPQVYPGLLAQESLELLQNFFQAVRT